MLHYAVKMFISSAFLQRTVKLTNNLLLSRLGARIVSANSEELYRAWIRKLLYFNRLLNLLRDVKGDIVECGVASGRSLAMFAVLGKDTGFSRHIWGFDSWEGLPQPSNVDNDGKAKKRMFANIGIDTTINTLKWYGITDEEIEENITLIKGWFSDTLPNYNGADIALLHIDADIYESYKTCLIQLWPRVCINGVVALDEYHDRHNWPGAKAGVDEFLSQQKPDAVTLLSDKDYNLCYLIKRA